jgi:nucleoside-diphosphate-sugar epimerase
MYTIEKKEVVIETKKTAIVIGAGGFIGSHVAARLKRDGYWVRGVDLKVPEFSNSVCDEFFIGDCRNSQVVEYIINQKVDRVFQLAADMGGIGYIGNLDNDADVMTNSAKINLNVVDSARRQGIEQVFFSSSACVYNEFNQVDPQNPDCREDTAYPAHPDTEYGWEKLFSERLYLSYNRQYGMRNRIARFHNIFGEHGTWQGGKEKAPAAICRKVAMVSEGGEIEIWGDGLQTRSFLHIDDCVEGIMRLMDSDFSGPVNIGSDHLISINDLVLTVSGIADKTITIKNIVGPQGVRGRNSNNDLIREKLNWVPTQDLYAGLTKTYNWIAEQVKASQQ